MSMRKRRVLVGRLFHESHSFNPRLTSQENFRIERGADLLSNLDKSRSVLAGIMRLFLRLGYDLVPAVSAVSAPSGLVEHRFYLSIKSELIEAIRSQCFDAIALDLHGAMATTEIPDVEGDLLNAIRAVVGNRIPVGVGLDLHGHITPAMLRAADVCIACKENPHSDMLECGERVAQCIDAILDHRLHPVSCLVKIPMILTGAAETGDGPLAELHRRAREAIAANPRLWDVSIFNVYPFADDVNMGQAVLALADGDPSPAIEISETIGDMFWRWREKFVDNFPDIERALNLVSDNAAQRPFVLADMGDRVLAGAPGDSTAILNAVLSRGDGLRGVIPITDPESAAAAIQAGQGATVNLKVGGKITPGFDSVDVTGEVLSVTDGCFEIKGPFQAGEITSFGPTAVVKVGQLSLILMTLPGLTQDLNAFESQGIDIASQDFLVVKSGYHFKMSFEKIATALVVETPGMSRYRLGFFNWRRGRVYPAHPISHVDLRATVFDRRSALC